MTDMIELNQRWLRRWKEYLYTQRMLFLLEDEEELYEVLLNCELILDGKSDKYVRLKYQNIAGKINMLSPHNVRIEFHGYKLDYLKRLLWKDEKLYSVIKKFNWLEIFDEFNKIDVA